MVNRAAVFSEPMREAMPTASQAAWAKIEGGVKKLQYDLFYVKNLSPLLDFHILLKAVKVVLLYCSAKGRDKNFSQNNGGFPIVKKIVCYLFFLALTVFASVAFAQVTPQDVQDITKELQKMPPETSEQLTEAMQKGDFQAAHRIYLDFKSKQQGATAPAGPSGQQPAQQTPSLGPGGGQPQAQQAPSLFERTLSGQFPSDILSAGLQQFGYDMFLKTTASFNPSATVPVGPDYIIGPGDQLTLTLWGTTEGIYTVTVSKEGNITLPKVGVVPVTGVRFGELEHTIRRHLSRYYANFNLSVAMGALKTVTVYVVGEVANPGSYSVNSLTTVYGALFVAGGPTKRGTMRSIQVLRSGKIIKTIDLYDFLLRGDRGQDVKLQHEDTVFVPLIGPIAGVEGTVYRPAIYELKGGETIADLIRTAGGIMPIALGSRIQLNRYALNEKKVILDIKASALPGAPQDQKEGLGENVRNMDLISVLPIYDKVWDTVNLSGDVRYPGNYQWTSDLRLKDVIELGQLLPTSELRRAEVIRLNKDFTDRTVIPVDLAALTSGDETQNMRLQPRDQVRVYTTYREAEKIIVAGEVVRPGTYEISKGERLSDLLRRVGGFTPEAYPYGAVFKRKDVKNVEAKNLQSFIARMQSQILQSAAGSSATALSTEEAAFAKTEMIMNQNLLNSLKTLQEQAEGRVAINITQNIDEWAASKEDLILQDGDSLTVPKQPQEVMVLGEVHSPGAQVFLPGLKVKDSIEHTGGFTRYADDSQVYVVQANGYAFSSDSPSIGNVENVKLSAGDTVFVPQKVERHAVMRNTKDIVDILFKTAVVIATITILF